MFKVFAVILSLQLIIAPVAIAQGSGAGEQFRQNPNSEAKKPSYMNQVKSIVVSAIGTTAIMACKNFFLLPSLAVFNAGSLIYIASELMGGKSQGDFHKRKAEDLKMVEEKMRKQAGGEAQKEALEAALKDEKEILSRDPYVQSRHYPRAARDHQSENSDDSSSRSDCCLQSRHDDRD